MLTSRRFSIVFKGVLVLKTAIFHEFISKNHFTERCLELSSYLEIAEIIYEEGLRGGQGRLNNYQSSDAH